MIKASYFSKFRDTLLSSKIVLPLLSGGLGAILTVILLSLIIGLDISSFLWTILIISTGLFSGGLIFSFFIWIINKTPSTELKSKETLSKDKSRRRSNLNANLIKHSVYSPADETPRVQEHAAISKSSFSENPVYNEADEIKSNNKIIFGYKHVIISTAAFFFVIIISVIIYFKNTSPFPTNDNTAQVNVNNNQNDSRQTTDEESINKAIENKPEELRAVLREYAKSPDIQEILRDGLEEKNVGGAITAATINQQFFKNKGIYPPPEKLGLKKITNEESLVRRVLKNEARINNIQISPIGNRQFKIKIDVTNLTEKPLKCLVQKGQVFELKDKSLDKYFQKSIKYFQNSEESDAASKKIKAPQTTAQSKNEDDDPKYIIPPRDDKSIELIAFCVNKGLDIPEGFANITFYTIYEQGDEDFNTPDDLHRKMRIIEQNIT